MRPLPRASILTFDRQTGARIPRHLVRSMRRATRIDTQEEETMTTSVIEAPAMGSGSLASPGERALRFLFARYSGRENVRRRMREEEAAIEAEDILAQAEEANALDPVG